MSGEHSLVGRFDHNNGDRHQYNFENTYLDDEDLKKPSKNVAIAISSHTQQQINKILGVKTQVSQKSLGNQVDDNQKVEYIRYTPSNTSGSLHNSGSQKRIIRMQEVQVDPLAPAQFKHKRVARGPPSPPTALMRSPPKKLTLQDQLDWKVPPCISNWKNPRGYTIPIDMRLSADGRTLQQHSVNEKFAKHADTLYITERQTRREIEERNIVQRSNAYKEYIKKEEQMRIKAKEARQQKEAIVHQHADQQDLQQAQGIHHEQEDEDVRQRDLMRYINKREKERDVRMSRAGISKSGAEKEYTRDISERVALGQAQPTLTQAVLDQGLMDKTGGLDSGFRDDEENIAYDKPLFKQRVVNLYSGLNNIQQDVEDEQTDGELERVLKKRPQKGFSGADNENAGSRTRPVEFERGETDGLLGMEGFLSQKKVKK